MAVLIDTSIAIDLRDGRDETRDRLRSAGEQPVLSMATVVELEGGVHARPDLSSARRIGVDQLLKTMPVLALDAAVVEQYGRILKLAVFRVRESWIG